MKNRNTTPPTKTGGVIDRWTAVARGVVVGSKPRLGTPKGKVAQLFRMEADWRLIPNTLLEDAAGQLWLAYTHGRFDNSKTDKTRGFEPVTVEEALDWMRNVLALCDGYDGDPIDLCRIALAELVRRPSDLDRVKRAVAEELEARPQGSSR